LSGFNDDWRCPNHRHPGRDEPAYCPIGGCSKEDGCARDKAVQRAAVAWCFDRPSRTVTIGDQQYFAANWDALPGLRKYVEIEMVKLWPALAGDHQGAGSNG
jgi:hypothetical protein